MRKNRFLGVSGLLASLIVLFAFIPAQAAMPEGFSVLGNLSGVVPPAPITPGTQTSSWVPSSAYTARGFAVYAADTLTNLTPEWAWTESSPVSRVATFACPGQYRSSALALRTLRAVSQLQSSCSDLRSVEGNILSVDNIDVRVVQYLRDTYNGKVFPGKGKWLEKPFPMDLQANWTQEGIDNAVQDGAQVRSYNMDCLRASWGYYQKRIGSTGNHQRADQWGQRAGHDTDDVYMYAGLRLRA